MILANDTEQHVKNRKTEYYLLNPKNSMFTGSRRKASHHFNTCRRRSTN